jgi:hypothetical protein
METSLHRQLKAVYAPAAAREVRVEGYRIDAVVDGVLIEIQQASLSALRDKVATLLEKHVVRVVKPLFARKRLVNGPCPLFGEIGDEIGHAALSDAALPGRWSPARANRWSVFLELVHFVKVFPHPRLTLEVLLVEVLEARQATRVRRGRQRHRVLDRQLLSIGERFILQSRADLLEWLPPTLPSEFTSADLAAAVPLPRWWAQKVTYCLREIGALETRGKRDRAWLYARPRQSRRRAA